MTPKKILLIDDNLVVAQTAREELERYGHVVKAVTTMDKFGQVLFRWHPDVVLTDVEMPDMSGLEVCRRLKSSKQSAHMPVVLYSSLSKRTIEQMARQCGADGYIAKADGIKQLGPSLDKIIG